MEEKEVNNKQVCDFCKEKESSGVYVTDHGPFSLAYCDECLKHDNIRTIFNGLSKWARLGPEKAFSEYSNYFGVEPNVYFKGKYMALRKLVEIITNEEAEEFFKNRNRNSITDLILEKLRERK